MNDLQQRDIAQIRALIQEQAHAVDALRARSNLLYDALALIENGCELASENVWPYTYISRIHEIATTALEAERKYALTDDGSAVVSQETPALLKDAGQSSVDQPASLSSREGFESGDDRSARSSVKA